MLIITNRPLTELLPKPCTLKVQATTWENLADIIKDYKVCALNWQGTYRDVNTMVTLINNKLDMEVKMYNVVPEPHSTIVCYHNTDYVVVYHDVNL